MESRRIEKGKKITHGEKPGVEKLEEESSG